MDESLRTLCDRLRAELLVIEKQARGITDPDKKEWPFDDHEETFPWQHAEMKAQATLAVRHIEDARMRLGKVLQYAGDGVSIYDKA